MTSAPLLPDRGTVVKIKKPTIYPATRGKRARAMMTSDERFGPETESSFRPIQCAPFALSTLLPASSPREAGPGGSARPTQSQILANSIFFFPSLVVSSSSSSLGAAAPAPPLAFLCCKILLFVTDLRKLRSYDAF